MTVAMRRFDLRALQAALEEARRACGLSWADVAAEINAPFAHMASLPISVTTIRGMAQKRSVTSAVVLQVLRWLGRTPESFLAPAADELRESLPMAGPDQVLRFDTRALHAALDQARRERGMTWRQVAAELPGFTPSMLQNLVTGPLIGFPRVMTLTQWLGQPAAAFVRARAA